MESVRRKSSVKNKDNNKNFILMVGKLLICLAMALILINRYTIITEQTDKMQSNSKEIESLIAKRDTLVKELEPYKSSSRIEKIAKIDLGMVYPSLDQYVEISSGYKFTKEELEEKEGSFFSSLFAAVFLVEGD